jgi:hypothetical protein
MYANPAAGNSLACFHACDGGGRTRISHRRHAENEFSSMREQFILQCAKR